MRSIALALVSVAVVGALAACGSGHKKTTSTSTTMSSAAEKAQIKSAYVKFFSSKTPLSTRVTLLQNGARFKPIISALATNPLASNTSGTVSSVTLEGANRAKVVYTVDLSGSPLPQLKKRTGSAVRENGAWKVGDASFCALVALGGGHTPTRFCKKP